MFRCHARRKALPCGYRFRAGYCCGASREVFAPFYTTKPARHRAWTGDRAPDRHGTRRSGGGRRWSASRGRPGGRAPERAERNVLNALARNVALRLADACCSGNAAFLRESRMRCVSERWHQVCGNREVRARFERRKERLSMGARFRFRLGHVDVGWMRDGDADGPANPGGSKVRRRRRFVADHATSVERP